MLTALAYVATLQFQFVYDDESQIVGNQLIEQWRFVPYYFHMQVWGHIIHQEGNYYRPIFMIWMRLNHALFGFHPFGWHLTTVLMHVLATFLVFKLAKRLSARDDIALIAAAIFGVHPVHVEAVSWVSSVTEALFAVLLISSFLCFLDWRDGRPNARGYSLLLYGLAIFSKETAVVMMPIVFVYAWIYPRAEQQSLARRFAKALLPALPYLAITFAYLYPRYLALDGLFHTFTPLPIRTKLLTIPSVLWFYLKLLFVPVGLSGFYDTPYVTSASLGLFWLPLIGISIFAAGLFYWWWKTRDRLVAFASAMLIVPLLPLMNFSVFFQGEIAHDRYLYTPSIGFALLVAIAITSIGKRLRRSSQWGELLLAAPILAIFVVLTISQSLYWSDNLVLYNRGVQVAPNNNLAVNNLANEFERRKMYPQALALYSKVLERKPNFYLTNFNFGYVSGEAGDFQTCARFLRRAAALDSTDGSTFYYLAKCEIRLNDFDAAETDLHRAMEIDPRLQGPHYTLGLLLKQQGHTQEALDEFRDELYKNPSNADARREVEGLTPKR